MGFLHSHATMKCLTLRNMELLNTYTVLLFFIQAIQAINDIETSKCFDTNKKCRTWALEGECYYNRGYMYIYCPESCDQCTIRDPKCIDKDIQCTAWADLGECKNNYKFMKKACRRACSFCLPSKADDSLPYLRANVVEMFWENGFPILKFGETKNVKFLPSIQLPLNNEI